MVLALVLAQLVLPGPPSKPLSPPGMVCMGECSDGPMVWRASPARGRLVVACDMRSDTCSDGRRIATTRSTPVPCEVAPGQWEMVGVDEGCYSVRGLESWAATTSYLSYGAELDLSPWGPSARGGSVTQIDDGWRVSNNPLEVNSGWNQRIPVEEDNETWTTSYIIRTWYPLLMAFYAGTSQSCGQGIRDTGAKWATFSCTRQVPKPSDPGALIYPGANTTGASHYVDVKAAWTVKGDAPGRACWGGEAPVTCAADRHTISTEGWPTTEGEISVTVTVGDTDSTPVIIDGRATSGDVGPMLYVTGAATNSIGWRSDSVTLTAPNVIERHKTHRIVAGRRDGRLYLVVDGVRHEGPEAPPLDWQGVAILGRGRVTTFQGLNGSISSLTVRSYEEVSP